MSDIAPIGRPSPAAYHNGSPNVRHVNGTRQPVRGDDKVELSRTAQLLGKLHDLPVRQDLVDRMRSEIATGAYDTPEKLDAALDSLLSDFED